MKLKGLPAYKGVVFGKASLYLPREAAPEPSCNSQTESTEEKVLRYETALRRADTEIEKIVCAAGKDDTEQKKIMCAHRMILEDVAMDEMIRNAITRGKSAANAICETYETFIALLQDAENQFTQERVSDMRDVRSRLLRCLSGEEEQSLSHLPEPVIIVTKELYPSDTVTIDRENVLAIVTETGGITSHTAILARSYGIPTVLSVPHITEYLSEGDELIVDAVTGCLYLDPTQEEITACRKQQAAYQKEKNVINTYAAAEGKTPDGIRIQIEMNISNADTVREEDAAHSDGVGLMRSEFLFMDREQLPDEETQLAHYRAALEKWRGKPVILRTVDIGGDKQLPCLPLKKEENPFLGKRALRLCFDRTDIFRTQLRAALRASVYGELWLMFPMVSSMDDWHRAKGFVQTVMEELAEEHIHFNPAIKLGIMIEVPSIAIMADQAAREVDFASVGTNDLCQYLMAADRMNPEVSAYYQTFNPAMFRILRYLAQCFTREKKPLGVCGEMGGDPRTALALVGMGIHMLSMNASAMPGVKRVINNITAEEARQITDAICEARTAEEAEAVLTVRLAALSEAELAERRSDEEVF